jgi:hypothetical protein
VYAYSSSSSGPDGMMVGPMEGASVICQKQHTHGCAEHVALQVLGIISVVAFRDWPGGRIPLYVVHSIPHRQLFSLLDYTLPPACQMSQAFEFNSLLDNSLS